MSKWSATELVFLVDPKELRGALERARIFARLDYMPGSQTRAGKDAARLVTVGILADADGRIGVIDGDRLVRGPVGKDTVQAIATELGAALWVPAWGLDLEPSPNYPNETRLVAEDGATVDGGPRSIIVAVTPAPMSAMPMYAAAVQQDLSVLDLGDRRVVMSESEGDAVGFGYFGWDEDSLPALVLLNEDGERTITLHTSDSSLPEAVHSWDLVTEFVLGESEKVGPGLHALIEEFFSAAKDAEAFARYANVAPARMASLMRDHTEGVSIEMLGLFGLPSHIARVLEGKLAPADVPGVETFGHESLRSAVSNSMKLYMGEQIADHELDQFWTKFDESFRQHPKLRRAIAVGEAALGGLLVASAAKSGGKIRGTFGALFLSDAFALAVLPELIKAWKSDEDKSR